MYYIYKIRTVRENNNKIFLRDSNISLSKRCLYFHFNFLMDSILKKFIPKIIGHNYTNTMDDEIFRSQNIFPSRLLSRHKDSSKIAGLILT